MGDLMINRDNMIIQGDINLMFSMEIPLFFGELPTFQTMSLLVCVLYCTNTLDR